MPTFRQRYSETERRDTELGVGRIEANEEIAGRGYNFIITVKEDKTVYEIQ